MPKIIFCGCKKFKNAEKCPAEGQSDLSCALDLPAILGNQAIWQATPEYPS